jgi:hypothetical protein
LNYEIAGSLLQIIPLILVYYNEGIIAVVMTLFTVLIQLLIQIKNIKNSEQISKNEKNNSKNRDPNHLEPSDTISYFYE